MNDKPWTIIKKEPIARCHLEFNSSYLVVLADYDVINKYVGTPTVLQFEVAPGYHPGSASLVTINFAWVNWILKL